MKLHYFRMNSCFKTKAEAKKDVLQLLLKNLLVKKAIFNLSILILTINFLYEHSYTIDFS